MTGSTRADQGEGINPRAVFRCVVCNDQIPAQALHSMPGNSADVICGRCVSKPSLHERYWPKCSRRDHDLFNHSLHHRRRAAALAFITERNAR